jgi:hypothetical protein
MEKKVYHFACLSDKDLNKKIDDLLPWPLTDLFITKAYSPIELQFRVYYASISEHTGFLLYALFYGLCFNECEVRLSYVKRYGDEITQPYYIFSLLGILPKKDKSQNITDLKPKNQVDQLKRVDQTKPSSLERMAMYLCPYRYFLDYVLSKGVVYKDSLQYQKVYENILVDRIWQKLSGRPKGQAESIFDKILKEESTVLEKYFPFWKTSDFYDLGLRVKNYIFKSGQLMERGNIKEYKPEDDHMDVRVDFGKAYFKIDISAAEPVNPYGIFEGFTSKNGTDKIYSLHVITHKYIDAQNSAVREYLNDAVATTAIISDWCIFCADKNLCLKPYLRDAVEDED